MRHAKTAPNACVIQTGIRGFDSLTLGGIPKGKITLLTGGPGVGKSVFAAQMAVTNSSAGVPGLYVAFEESPAEVLANMSTFRWPRSGRMERNLRLMAGDLDPDVIVSGNFDIGGLLASLEAEHRKRRAEWVVLDGLDQLLGLLADPIAERREIFRLKRWAESSQVACLITTKEDAGGWVRELGQADGLIAFAADCIVRLHVSIADTVLHRGLRIVKYRGFSGPGNEYPMVISEQGILVGHAHREPAVLASGARRSTPIQASP